MFFAVRGKDALALNHSRSDTFDLGVISDNDTPEVPEVACTLSQSKKTDADSSGRYSGWNVVVVWSLLS